MSGFINYTSVQCLNHSSTTGALPGSSSKMKGTTFLVFAILVFTAILVVGLNSYVLSIFYRGRNVKSKSNIPLISLAAADLQSGLVNIPLILTSAILAIYRGQNVYLFTMLADVSSVFCAATTMSNLFVIVILRYLAICHPMKYLVVDRDQIWRCIILAWVASLAFSLVRLQWLLPAFSGNSEESVRRAWKSDKIYYTISIVLYLIIVFSMISLFLQMFRAIRNRRAFLKKEYSDADPEPDSSSVQHEVILPSVRKGRNTIYPEMQTSLKTSYKQEQRMFPPSMEIGTERGRNSVSCHGDIFAPRTERGQPFTDYEVFSAKQLDPRQKCVFDSRNKSEWAFQQEGVIDSRIDNDSNSAKGLASDSRERIAPSFVLDCDSRKRVKLDPEQNGVLDFTEIRQPGPNKEGVLDLLKERKSSLNQEETYSSRKEKKLAADQGVLD